MLYYILHIVFSFMFWMLWAYFVHFIAHIYSRWNLLFKIHMFHHKRKYNMELGYKPNPITIKSFLLFFGTWQETLDVIIILFLPIVIISFFSMPIALVFFIIFYFYESILSEDLFDHNPNIQGRITKFMACGVYHLKHHITVSVAFSFYTNFYDICFATAPNNFEVNRYCFIEKRMLLKEI